MVLSYLKEVIIDVFTDKDYLYTELLFLITGKVHFKKKMYAYGPSYSSSSSAEIEDEEDDDFQRELDSVCLVCPLCGHEAFYDEMDVELFESSSATKGYPECVVCLTRMTLK